MNIHPADRLLPNQPYLLEFCESKANADRLLWESICSFSGITIPRQDFKLVEHPQLPLDVYASEPIALRLLQLLVTLRSPRHILEIGTYIGLSSMSMARVLPLGATITTIEKFDEFHRLAEENFMQNGLSDRINLVLGDAFELLSKQPPTEVDMIFLDGNKERYKEYFQLLDPILKPGGLFVIDDAWFSGDVSNQQPRTDKGAGVQALLLLLRDRVDYSKLLLPISNGLMIMVKS